MHRSKVLSYIDFVFQTNYTAFTYVICMSYKEQKEKSYGKIEVSQGDDTRKEYYQY